MWWGSSKPWPACSLQTFVVSSLLRKIGTDVQVQTDRNGQTKQADIHSYRHRLERTNRNGQIDMSSLKGTNRDGQAGTDR